jgi:hypothetical protein
MERGYCFSWEGAASMLTDLIDFEIYPVYVNPEKGEGCEE